MTNASNFDNTYAANVVGLWDFQSGAETKDTGLDDGIAQNGAAYGGGKFWGGWFDASCKNARFDVDGSNDAPFQIDSGTLVAEFTQTGEPSRCDAYSTVVSRGEAADAGKEGFFEVRVTKDGTLQVVHADNGAKSVLSSDTCFVGKGDDIKVTYSWDAATGNSVLVENLSDGTSFSAASSTLGLTFDLTDNDDESLTIGAEEKDDGVYGHYFDGRIDYVAILDQPVLMAPEGDGIVEGTAGDDLIDIAYTGDPDGDMIDNNDAILPGEGPNDDIVEAGAGNDTVNSGLGDDTVYAGSGDDTVDGGEGNDTIYGDSNYANGSGIVRESFEWDKAPDPGDSSAIDSGDSLDNSFTQNTGSVDVTYSVISQSHGVDTEFTDEDLNVSGIQTDGAPADDNSGLLSVLNGKGHSASYQLGFSASVSNVSFNINDIDGDGIVRVKAYDAAGNEIPVALVGGANLTLKDTDTVAGNDTADSNGGYDDTNTSPYNLNVTVAGPVARIVIEHYQDGTGNTGVRITDVFFDAATDDTGADGNDTLSGGAGDDIIFGEGGNDVINGGQGNDTLDGGEGDDIIKGGPGDDTIIGGNGLNTLDGGSGNDTITGGDDKDIITGGSGNDTVYGGGGDDVITTGGASFDNLPDRGFPSYNGLPTVPADSDPFNDRDYVDGGDGNDTISTGDDEDVIFGGAGNDTIDGGLDDDTIDGGDGDDFIIGGEGSDTIQGGAGNDEIYGGLGPVLPDALNIRDDGSDGPADPVTDNGMDVIHGGDGDDIIFGQDDDDTLYGDAGDDILDGGIDDDMLYGGVGNDTLKGGQGNDLLDGGAGNDRLFGGDDRDTFVNVNAGDVVHGGSGYSLDPSDDFDTLDLTGSAGDGSFTLNITGPDSDGNGFDGYVDYFDADSNLIGKLTFTNIENFYGAPPPPPCFTPGTLIATPKGERLVETLKVGDRVITRDNGIQVIRWVGHTELSGQDLARAQHLRPVLIRQGALGHGLPERDMMVSPNHRVLVASEKTALYFEESEVLVAAKHLTGLEGVDVVEASSVTYIHFMFDQHEVVLSDGTWTESFQPGDLSLNGIGNAQRNEILELFPELKTREGLDAYQSARRSLKRHEARLLV